MMRKQSCKMTRSAGCRHLLGAAQKAWEFADCKCGAEGSLTHGGQKTSNGIDKKDGRHRQEMLTSRGVMQATATEVSGLQF